MRVIIALGVGALIHAVASATATAQNIQLQRPPAAPSAPSAPAGSPPPVAPGAPPSAGQSPAVQSIKVEQLSREKFLALPDSAVIEIEGQPKTKAALRMEMEQRAQQAIAKTRADAGKANSRLEVLRAKVAEQDRAQTNAYNAKVAPPAGRAVK